MATNPDYKAEKGTRRAARLHVRPTRPRTHQISLTRTSLFLPARLSRIPQPRAPPTLQKNAPRSCARSRARRVTGSST